MAKVKETSGADVVIVPDVTEADMIYPYPIPANRTQLFPKSAYQDISIVKDLGSPALFSVNGKLNIGVSNGDILIDSNKVCKHKGSSNKINAQIEAIVSQKNMYPLSPTMNPFDVSKMNALNFEQESGTKPDIWFMPSKLKKFVEVFDGVICVNPALCTYKESFGNFARVLVDERFFDKKRLGNEKPELADNCKIEILKM